MSDVSQKPPVHFTSSEGYFDLTPALRDASLLSTGSGASGHHDSATDRTGDSQKPRTMPATDSALSTSSQLAGSKPVAAFIDAFGQQKSVDSLQPDTDLRPPQRDQRAQSAPPATFSESAQSTEAVSALGGGGGASYTSEPAFGPKPAGEGDLISNREGKQTDLGGLMLAASSAQSTPPNRRSASDVM